MSQWDSFASMAASKQTPCTIGRLLGDLPDEGRIAVSSALDAGLPVPGIRNALRQMMPGHGVPSESSWIRHRDGRCCCEAAA